MNNFHIIACIIFSATNASTEVRIKPGPNTNRLVLPDFTIFDIQRAYPDDVTLAEVFEGLIESPSSLVSSLPDFVGIRFSRAVIMASESSPFTIFSLAGAIHFAQVALAQSPDMTNWILSNIVIELLDAVIRVPRTPLERRLNIVYNDFSGDMRTMFGSTRAGIMSFEAIVVFLQLDSISVTDRRHVMLKFMLFINSSKSILKDRSASGFEQAHQILVQRESIMQVLEKVHKILINLPLTEKPETTSVSGTKNRWEFFDWYRPL